MNYSADLINVSITWDRVEYKTDRYLYVISKSTLNAIASIWGDGWITGSVSAEINNIIHTANYITRDGLDYGICIYDLNDRYYLGLVNRSGGVVKNFVLSESPSYGHTTLKVANISYYCKLVEFYPGTKRTYFTISEYLKDGKDTVWAVDNYSWNVLDLTTGNTIEDTSYATSKGIRQQRVVKLSSGDQHLVLMHDMMNYELQTYENGHIMRAIFDYDTTDTDKVVKLNDKDYMHIAMQDEYRKYMLIGEQERTD